MPGTSQMASSGICSALRSKAYEVCPPGADTFRMSWKFCLW